MAKGAETQRRQLALLRHAKSSWDDPGIDDHDRVLAPRGRKALQKIAAHLPTLPTAPELVLCSSARRTVQTLEGISPALADHVAISVEDQLYAADSGQLLQRLRAVDDAVASVLLIGHNPGMEDLAALLIGAGDASLRADLASSYPTAALATLTFPGSWSALSAGCASLDGYVVPRRL
jgi:phosphohistidine phosphatase